MSSQSTTGTNKKIFISYRRTDSQDITGRIYDRLDKKFPESVFLDIDSIPYGEDFREHLYKQLADCRVLLAIVGKKWADNPRLQEEDDQVRMEIDYGLDPEHDIDVIPVLVSDAVIPSKDQLPDSLKDFPDRNGIKVPSDAGIEMLIKNLTSKGLVEKTHTTAAPTPSHRPYRIRGREIYDPKELAVYLSENWAEGVKQFERAQISDWLKSDYRDQGMYGDLTDITEDEELDADQNLSAALLVLNNELPLFWYGNLVSLDWLTSNPQKAVEICQSRLLHYYRQHRADDDLKLGEIAGRVKKVAGDDQLEGEVRNLVISMAVNQEYPLSLGGNLITPQWLAANPRQAVNLCLSNLPEWHISLRKEKWLSEKARVVREAETDMALKTLPEAFASVIGLILDEKAPLEYLAMELTHQWLAANPGEAVKILESSLPDWYARLRGNRMLIETQDARRALRESVRALGVPVVSAKVDELALQNEEEREARFKALWQKFESGEYGGAKDEQLQAVLDRGAPGPVEQIALLCCDKSLFLTPQEKHLLDSLQYLQRFRVPMDWQLAERLIAANSWEAINPLWLKIRSSPLQFGLAGNEKIAAIHRAQEAQYLDVVALVAADAADLIDPNNPDHLKIEAAIRNEICKHTGKLTEADLLKVTRLFLEKKQITDVSPLKELTQLKALWLNYNQITDVSALKELTQLETLNLRHNQITDVSALKELTQLTNLWLFDNQISKSDIVALNDALPYCNCHIG